MQSKLRKSDLLTSDEIAALMVACKRLHQRAFIEFLLESGCRLSEALGITMRDIEFDDNFLIVSVDGKTGPRTIPLLRSKLPVFLIYISPMRSGRIFPFSKSDIIRQFRRVYKNAGVQRPVGPLHIFRHLKATFLLEGGTPETIIRRFMGWSDNSNMVSYYTHLSTQSVKDYFSRIYGIAVRPQEPLYPQNEMERITELLR